MGAGATTMQPATRARADADAEDPNETSLTSVADPNLAASDDYTPLVAAVGEDSLPALRLLLRTQTGGSNSRTYPFLPATASQSPDPARSLRCGAPRERALRFALFEASASR